MNSNQNSKMCLNCVVKNTKCFVFHLMIMMLGAIPSNAQNDTDSKTWYQKIIDDYEQSQQHNNDITNEDADRYIDRPYYYSRDTKSCNISAIEVLNDYTIVRCQFNPSQTRNISFNSGAYIYDRESGDRYNFVKSEVIPLYPDKAIVEKGEKYEFTLYFQPIPKYVTCIDILENSSSHNAINFYKVDVTGNKHQKPEVQIVVKKKIVKVQEKVIVPSEKNTKEEKKRNREPKIIDNIQDKMQENKTKKEKLEIIM